VEVEAEAVISGTPEGWCSMWLRYIAFMASVNSLFSLAGY